GDGKVGTLRNMEVTLSLRRLSLFERNRADEAFGQLARESARARPPLFNPIEQARMPETDVDSPEAAGTEVFESTSAGRPNRRHMRIDPRDDVLDEVILPDPGPLALMWIYDRAGGGNRRDERRASPPGPALTCRQPLGSPADEAGAPAPRKLNAASATAA